ncbi:hypothetical protein JIR23_03035 [Bradyrhizobium diazoefficiens]|nr:hypothetical protein [Bradyrhizobium diazoefficiens]QQN64810.1 hypothetical protein JIR23_03035 [Bradyrhizobium diazoefficiens]
MNGKRVIGIDVGKSWLDVSAEGCERLRRYGNDAAAIAALVEQLDPAEDLVVFERTGGWERNLEAALADRMNSVGRGSLAAGQGLSPSARDQGQNRPD